MGGWIASELVATCTNAVGKLMLVGAAGVKPREGEIADIFIISPAQVLELQFHDTSQVENYDAIYGRELSPEEQLTSDLNREMGCATDLEAIHVRPAAGRGSPQAGQRAHSHGLGPTGPHRPLWSAAAFTRSPSPAPTSWSSRAAATPRRWKSPTNSSRRR